MIAAAYFEEVVVHGDERTVAAAVVTSLAAPASFGRTRARRRWRPPALHRRRARDNVPLRGAGPDSLPRRADRLRRSRSGPLPRARPQGRAGRRPALREAIGEPALRLDVPAGIEGIDVGPDPARRARSSSPSGSPPTPGARGAAGSWSTAAPAATTRSASRSRTAASASSSSATCHSSIDRRAGPLRAAAAVRGARARPRARHRALPHPGVARRRRSTPSPTPSPRWSSRRPTSAPSPTSPRWPRSRTRAACR